MADPTFVVIGAGSIGCFVGASLYHAGFKVRFLVRESSRSNVQISVLSKKGLTLLHSADANFRKVIPATEIPEIFTTDVSCLKTCSCVLVATKRVANVMVHQQLLEQGVCCPVVFLQNGLCIRSDVRSDMEYEAVESVVSFNVVYDADAGAATMTTPFSEAKLVLDGQMPSASSLVSYFGKTPIPTIADDSLLAVQCGKILLNLANAVNALSGLAIGPMLFQEPYRHVLAKAIEEGKAVFAAQGLTPKAANKADASLLRFFVYLLRFPQWLFMALLGKRLRANGDARTSMQQDLLAGRIPTEIDYLNGEIVRRGRKCGVSTPVNEKLVELIKQAEIANQGPPEIPGQVLADAVGVEVSPSPNITAGTAMTGGVVGIGLVAAFAARSWRARM